MNKLKNNKGVTMVALIITIIIMIILLTVINFGSNSAIEMRNLNNMYADILILDEKVALYYLKNGDIPVMENEEEKIMLKEEDLSSGITNNNPNNNDKYYIIDVKKLDNLTLNNLKDTINSSDRYIVNEQSHTIYYQKGVLLDGKVYYTLPENYQKVELSKYQ